MITDATTGVFNGVAAYLDQRSVNSIFRAIRSNQLSYIRQFFDRKEHVRMVDTLIQDGETLLISACQHGELPIVEYLVDKLNASITMSGTVKFENEVIEDAPPIWVASAAGHIAIVKYLLKRGADVNAVTSTNSTSLRAACFDGHFDIVECLIENGADLEIANRHNHTCLMIACFKKHSDIVRLLVRKGADVNRRSRKGNTALHDCAEGGSTEIMEFLLKNGATFQRDVYGVTPLMAAAISAHAAVVRFLITYLFKGEYSHSLPPFSVSFVEQVEVFEMLGCSMIDKKQDLTEGLNCWKQAASMRHTYEGLIPQKEIAPAEPEFGNITEFSSKADVERMLAEHDSDHIRMQSLIVRQRLLGFKHPDTTYYIRYRGAVLADMGDYSRCLRLWRYVLKKLMEDLDELSSNVVMCTIQSYSELFGYLHDITSRPRIDGLQEPQTQHVKVQDVTFVIESAIKFLYFYRKNEKELFVPAKQPIDNACMRLITKLFVLGFLIGEQTPGELHKLKRTLYQFFLSGTVDKRGNTLLHLLMNPECCSVERNRVTGFPSTSAINIFFECGADPNISNKDCLTPLAYFLRYHVMGVGASDIIDIIDVFVANGCHIDSYHVSNPLLSSSQLISQLLRDGTILGMYYPASNLSLKCLAARCVRAFGINTNILPPHLQNFVQVH